MSEVRAPDPTLTAYWETRHDPNIENSWLANWVKVGVNFAAHREGNLGAPPIAHRLTPDDTAACGATGDAAARNEDTRAWRWVATPCRERGCFPDAPEPGVDPLSRPNAGRYLAWQRA